MTSNVGSTEFYRHPFGFRKREREGIGYQEQLTHSINDTLKKTFHPEFLNRIDETVIFDPLNPDQVGKIVQIMLGSLSKR